MKKLGIILAAVVVLAMAACTSTRVTTSWRANDAQLKKGEKVMVMAVVPPRDRTLRAQMEGHTVSELRRKGYNAVSALDVYGPGELEKMNEKQMVNKLKGSDVGQVMTIVLLDRNRQRNFVPDYGMYGPYGYYRFWPYYSMWYNRMYTPGYYTYDMRYQWESNLYDLQTGQMLYSVQSKSYDPPTTERMAVLYAQQVVKDMGRQQILANN